MKKFHPLFLVMLLAPLALHAEMRPPEKHRVFFVNQRIELTPWSLAMLSECRDEFERLSGHSVGMVLENMPSLETLDAKESFSQSLKEKNVDFIIARNHFTAPPLILAAQTGLPLIVPACDDMWIDDSTELPPNVHITTVHPSSKKTVITAFNLFPKTKKLIVISGAHETDRFYTSRAKKELGAVCEGVPVDYWTGLSLTALKTRVAELPDDHVILLLKMTSDAKGILHIPRDVAHAIVGSSRVPVFGTVDTFVEEGALGGYVVSFKIVGKRGGEMLARLAAGETLPAIEHIEEYGEYQFNWKAMQRWGIRERQLPTDSQILYRPERIFDRHPWIQHSLWGLTTALALILCAALLFLSNRRQVLIKLLKNEAWMKLSTEKSGVAIWEYDLQKNCMARSENHDQLYGVEPQKIWTSEMFLDALHPDDRDVAMHTIDEAIAPGGPEGYRFDYRTIWPDGTLHWLLLDGEISERDAEGTATRMRGCLIDVTDRKQAEEALADQAWRIDYILQGTNVGTWEWNVQTGKTIFNERWAEIIGYTLEELAPVSIETWTQFCHPDDQEESSRLLQECFTGERTYYNCEARMRHKNGEWIWVLDRGKVASWTDDGQPLWMYGTHQDINERKQAEVAVASERDRSQQYLDVAGVLMVALDHTQKVIMINPRGCEVLGVSREEIIGKNWFDHFIPQDQADEVKAVYNQIMTGELEPVEYHDNRIVRADGTQRVISWHNTILKDDEGNITGLLSSGDDITERMETQRALQESEERARLMAELVANSDQPVAVGFADGRLGRFNPAFCELVGYAEEEIQALDWTVDLTPPEWLTAEREVLVELERTGEPVRYEKEYIRKDGSRVPIELFVNLSRDENGEPEYYFAFITDITERKRAEERDQRKQYHLENAQILGKIGSWDLDVEKNALTWTDETYRIFGLPIGSPLTYEIFLDRIHPDDRELVDQKWTAAIRGEEAYDIEHRLLMDDGELKWVREKADLVFDEAGQCLRGTGFTQDITERMRAEEALRDSEAATRRKLKAITEPESDLGDLELSDFIDSSHMQHLMDEMHGITGMCVGIADLKGNIIASAGWRDICSKFHRVHPETAKNCKESDTILTSGVVPGEFKLYRCKNQMWEAAAPIMVADEQMGNIFFGQFFFDDEEVDIEAFREQARRCGFDEADYLAALEDVPRYSRETAEHAMRFYTRLADIISSQSYSNIKLSRALAEREQAQKELHQSEERLREAQRTAQIAHWNFDPETGNTEWSEQMYDILGLDSADGPADFADHPTFIHPSDWEGFEATVQQAVEHGTPYDMILRIQRPHGREGFINAIGTPITDESGTVIELRGTIQDITERKRIENRLKENEEKLRLMFEQAPLPLCMNGFDGTYLSVNPAYEKLTGYTTDELRNMTFFDITHPDDQPKNRNLLQNMSKDVAPGFDLEKRYLRKDGSEIVVMVHGTAVHDAEGVPLFGLAVVEDITALKRAKDELLESHDQLEQRVEERTVELKTRRDEAETLNRGMINLLQDLQTANCDLEQAEQTLRQTNSELESFSYSVSHDLRAPLRHIDGFVKLLLNREKSLLDATSMRYLDNISRSSGRMGRLIDDLLSLSRTGRTEMHLRTVDSNKMVQEIVKELAPTTDDRCVAWEIEDLPFVQADKGLLHLVWGNLIGNAIKYTGHREKTCIAIGTTQEGCENGSGEVAFFVRDNGAGFDPQYAHKLFGVFQRLHREDEFEGTGIGLATVQRIIHRHGGRVWAAGEVDQGATFYFTLEKAEGVE